VLIAVAGLLGPKPKNIKKSYKEGSALKGGGNCGFFPKG
jgi:hypothetical protein